MSKDIVGTDVPNSRVLVRVLLADLGCRVRRGVVEWDDFRISAGLSHVPPSIRGGNAARLCAATPMLTNGWCCLRSCGSIAQVFREEVEPSLGDGVAVTTTLREALDPIAEVVKPVGTLL